MTANQQMENKYVVYENWRAQRKAIVHKSQCGHAAESHERLTDISLTNNHYPNDRWFGYFESLDEAVAFSRLLPRRLSSNCRHCLRHS